MLVRENFEGQHAYTPGIISRRLVKTVSQQGRRGVKTGGVPLGYVEDFDEPRTTLGVVFTSL